MPKTADQQLAELAPFLRDLAASQSDLATSQWHILNRLGTPAFNQVSPAE